MLTFDNEVIACRTGVFFASFRGTEANAKRAGVRASCVLLPSHATRASRSPRFRLCSPEIRKKVRLFCRLSFSFLYGYGAQRAAGAPLLKRRKNMYVSVKKLLELLSAWSIKALWHDSSVLRTREEPLSITWEFLKSTEWFVDQACLAMWEPLA